jgi:hypothetical protein
LLELGIDLKASVEEVGPDHLISRGQQPRVNERFGSHDYGCTAFECKPPQVHPPPPRAQWVIAQWQPGEFGLRTCELSQSMPMACNFSGTMAGDGVTMALRRVRFQTSYKASQQLRRERPQLRASIHQKSSNRFGDGAV